jgi:hypothetical protein
MTATQRGGLYFLDQERDSTRLSAACAACSVSDPALQIWHGKLAHLSEQGIKELMNMSTRIKPIQKTCLCKGCALGRLKQVPHEGKTLEWLGTVRSGQSSDRDYCAKQGLRDAIICLMFEQG